MDITLPESLRPFVKDNMRIMVFAFLLTQFALAVAFDLFFKRRAPLWHSGPPTGSCFKIPELFHGFRLKPAGRLDIVSIIVFLASLSIYSWLIMDHANLSWPDQSHITAEAMSGKLWMQICPQSGRFSPLVHQEYLIIPAFAKIAWHYYAISLCELLILSGLMLVIIPVTSIFLRLLIISMFIYSSGFATAISGLIYPEVNIVFSLIAFVYFAGRHHTARKQPLSRKYVLSLLGMVVLAIYLIYLKEPFFLVFASYSVLAILGDLAGGGFPSERHDGKMTPGRSMWLMACRYASELCILALAMVYGLVYFLYIFIQTVARYGAENDIEIGPSILRSIQHTPILLVFFAYLWWRIITLVRQASRFLPVWDPLAFSFVLYYDALVVLGLHFSYYYVPIAFLSILYLSYILGRQIEKRPFRIAIAVFCMSAILGELPYTLAHFNARELYMQSRDMAVDALASLFHLGKPRAGADIYFIDRGRGYDTDQFQAYLGYRGIKYYFHDQQYDNKEEPAVFRKGRIIPVPIESSDSDVLSQALIMSNLLGAGHRPVPGDLLLSLPYLSENAIKIDATAPGAGTLFNIDLVSVNRPHLGNVKRTIYSLRHKWSDEDANFTGYVYIFNGINR